MPRAACFAGLLGVFLLACGELPRGFELVSLPDAQALLAAGDVPVVDVLEVGLREPGRVPGGVRWRVAEDGSIRSVGDQSEVPPGTVLVIASSRPAGHLAGAALARAGNRPIYVFIPETREQRTTLLAARLDKELARGEDS